MTFLTNLTLWKKITLLTTLGLLLGAGVFSSLGMRAVNRATETMLQDRMTTARLVESYVDEILERALSELESTSHKIEAGEAKADIEPQVVALEATYSRLSIHTRTVFLIDQRGQTIWSKGDVPELEALDMSSYPSIIQAMKEGKASISGLTLAPATAVPVILLAGPTDEGNTGNRRALVVAVDLAQSSIGGFIHPIRLGETGYVEIIDQNGIVVTRTEPGPKLAPFEQSDHSGRFAELIAAGRPTRGVCHTCHEAEQRVQRRDVLAFVPLSMAPWGVVVRQSEEEALAPARELHRNLLLFGAGLVTIALVFVLVTTRNIGSRLKALTVASQRIAKGDLASSVPASGKDEVGTLAQTLDDMRVKLKASYGELEQKTKELSALLSVSEILTSASDLPYLLDAVVAKAVEVIPGADGGVLLLRGASPESIQIQCAVGLDRGLIPQLMLVPESRSSDSALGQVEDRQEDEFKKAVSALVQSETLRIQSHIYAVISQQNRHIGGLVMVSFRQGQSFSESDSRVLHAVADYIAMAIEKSQLAKEAEKAIALREADRLRSQIISSVSHELRAPLTLIKGYSTSLLRPDASWTPQAQQEFLRIIDEKTDELRDLIDKLLQSAKLEAGALKLEKEPVLIPRLARKVVDDMTPRARKHRLLVRFPPSFPVVDADARCLEEVLRNLVENAVKYSPEGSEVVIAGEVKDGTIVVSVSDQGIGISPEHQDKVFQRFYRVGDPAVRSIPGSGLGLFIVKGHVEAHGGKVWLESSAGKGSTFCFSLPLNLAEGSERESGEGR
ncbi:MAG: ATP-binding protein [Chloroflexota bacterium]